MQDISNSSNTAYKSNYSLIMLILRLCMGLILSVSFIGKTLSFDLFARQITETISTSQILAQIIAVGILFLEFVIAISLIVNQFVKYSSLVAALMFVVFTMAMAHRALMGNAPSDCGCFGGLIASPVDVFFFARNSVLIVVSIIIFIQQNKQETT